MTAGRPRATNTVVLLRDAYTALNEVVVAHLVRAGHAEVRPSHSAVFEHLDEDGTTVSTLATRARMTKQAMAELVLHLEGHGYVERVPDPSDRRAKLVRPTERGRELVRTAQALVPEIESILATIVGRARADRLRQDLAAIAAIETGTIAG